jgi:hypothetical protein
VGAGVGEADGWELGWADGIDVGAPVGVDVGDGTGGSSDPGTLSSGFTHSDKTKRPSMGIAFTRPWMLNRFVSKSWASAYCRSVLAISTKKLMRLSWGPGAGQPSSNTRRASSD